MIRGDKNNSDSSMYLQTQIHSLLLGNSSNGNSSNGNSINGNSSNDTECPEEDDSDVVSVVSYTE